MGAPAATSSRIARRFPILSPLRHRDFRFLWAGMSVSLLGDGITTIALAWQAYEISNVPTALALIGVAQTVPHVLLLLVSGAVSDRFERRKVLIAADAVRMLAMCALGVLAVTGTIQIWHMMLIAARVRRRERVLRSRVRCGRARSRTRSGAAAGEFARPVRPPGPVPHARARRSAAGSSRCSVGAPAPPSSSTPRRSRCRSGACSPSAGIRSPRRRGRRFDRTRDRRGTPVRAHARLAVGHVPRSNARVPDLLGAGGGAAALHRQGGDGRLGRRTRTRVRVRRRRRDARRDLHVEPRPPAAEHDVHVRGLDRLDADGRRATGWPTSPGSSWPRASSSTRSRPRG